MGLHSRWDVFSSPAVADGKVYIGSYKLYCLNADTGEWMWESTIGDIFVSSPAVADDKVYIGSWDCKVYCLNADTGALIWDYTTGENVYSSPAVADDKVYIGSHDDKVYCFGSENQPPSAPVINGQTSGKVGVELTFTFHAYDPDGDDIRYFIKWGDNNTEWTNYYPSCTNVTIKHTWDEKGDYVISVKAEDIHGAESEWGTLDIAVPKNKTFNFPLLNWFFERFPNAFPLLRYLAGL